MPEPKRLPDGRWTIRWRTPDGSQRRRTFHHKRDAERFLRQTLVEQEKTAAGIPKRGETVSAAIRQWWPVVERSVKPRTAERYLLDSKIIEERVGDWKLADVDYQHVQGFVNNLSATYAPRTVRGIYGVFALILKDAAKRGQIRAIPKPTMPRVSAPKLLIPTRDEVEQLAAVIDGRLHTAVILAGYCGLRQGELLGLHRRDVNLDDGWVFVHQAKNRASGALEGTKTDQARRVYLPQRAKTALTQQLEEYPGEAVFPFAASGHFHRCWNTARVAVGIPRVRFHDLRHAAASMMIHAGWSVTQVAQQLGHADPAMTLRTYSHLWPTSYEDAIRKMDAYLSA